MKKLILMMMVTLSLGVFQNVQAAKYLIYIGAKASDGTGLDSPLGPITWGGGCKSDVGICIKEITTMTPSASFSEDLTINSNLNAVITIKQAENLKNLERMVQGSFVTLPDNIAIYSENLQPNFNFLAPRAKYFIPSGRYQIQRKENGIIVINVKIVKI